MDSHTLAHVAMLVEMGFDARVATGAVHDHPRYDSALCLLPSALCPVLPTPSGVSACASLCLSLLPLSLPPSARVCVCVCLSVCLSVCL